MADPNTVAAIQRNQGASIGNPIQRFMAATELDTRLIGMIGALVLIWVGFHILSGGLFLTPRNLWNLSVQSSEVAVMATGMVLVIVTRNIDLDRRAVVVCRPSSRKPRIAPMVTRFWLLKIAVGGSSDANRLRSANRADCSSWRSSMIGMVLVAIPAAPICSRKPRLRSTAV